VCKKCGGSKFRREEDILDVWFDSGVSFAAVAQKRANLRVPVDLYLEGSDQHRGWFHSSLLCSVGTREVAPYKAVLTHGFVVDGEGKKMSKLAGNYVPFDKVLKEMGAEILRLWVASSDYREDIRVSPKILESLSEGYRKIRNTLRYCLGNLHDFDPARDAVPVEELLPIDRWASPRSARPTKTTSSTSSTTGSSISARPICRRSTSTSSKTGSTPREPAPGHAGQRRPCCTRSSSICCACSRR
jgi:isoleucyl-tRNA synthetase